MVTLKMVKTFKVEDILMRKIYSLTALAAALLFSACQALDPAEEPAFQKEPQRATLPYSLVFSTESTKVDFDSNGFHFAEGDKIKITGENRDDIDGVLTLDPETGVAEGTISYQVDKGEPTGNTGLVATLMHVRNTDISTYANAVVGYTDEISLEEAAEKYSLFTATFPFSQEEVTLDQKTSYLDVVVTFTYTDDTLPMVEGVETTVDMTTSLGALKGKASVVTTAGKKEFTAKFVAVVPAGDNAKDFNISVCDRPVSITKDLELVVNKKYKVSRAIGFQPQKNDPFWSDGTFGRISHKEADARIVGIVMYVNENDTELERAITEADNGGGHGLVMALKNASAVGESWGAKVLHTEAIKTPQGIRTPETRGNNGFAIHSGYANTKAEVDDCRAAQLANQYDGGTDYGRTTTGWFLPSIGQWFYAICSYGATAPIEEWTDNDGKNYLEQGNWNSLIRVKKQDNDADNAIASELNETLKVWAEDCQVDFDGFGMSFENKYADNYWTSSEKDNLNAIRMNFGSVERDQDGQRYTTIKTKPEGKASTYTWERVFIMKVRPFLAF